MKDFLLTFSKGIQFSFTTFNFGEPQHLPKQAEIIRKKFDVQPHPPEDITDLDILLSKVCQLWQKKGKEGLSILSYREIKWLPWVLYHGPAPKIVAQKDLLMAVLQLIKERWSINLVKLIHVYLKYYDPEVAGTETIRKTILELLTSCEVKNIRLKRWQTAAVLLFSPNASKITAHWLMNEKDKVDNSLQKLGLVGDLANCYFLRYVILEILETMKQKFPYYLENLLSLLVVSDEKGDNHIVRTSTIARARFPELIPKAAAYLLPAAGVNADPLAKKDLEFFFIIVEKSCEDAKWVYRRRFWEAYLPYIENTWVVLGRKARQIVDSESDFNSELRTHLAERKPSKLKGARSDQSAFLIEMRGYIFVEWSNSGACRIWRKERFPLPFGAKEYLATQVRSNDADYRQDHMCSESYRWQDRMAHWFYHDSGIPFQNYRVE
ncbi:MAG: EH signature domain-containing protein [Bacillota bacterium]